MTTNSEVSELLLAIADLLDLRGERFKPDAYRRAARSILGAGEDLRALRKDGLLGEIPGVGEAIRAKIEEYLDTGRIEFHDRLRAEVPPGVLALMQIQGVGPKTASRFHRELGIDSPGALLAAIAENRLAGVAGFGPRKIQNLVRDVGKASGQVARRLPLRVGWGIARGIVREIVAEGGVDQVEIAGSLRRRRESVGDIDILATSASPDRAIEKFAHLAGVQEIVVKGETKCTVIFDPGIQVDLRVVSPESFGAALQYFTGSKDHNVRVRTWARDRGLKINEYGVFRGEERVAGASEEEVYRALALPWIPPEIRENQGELEEAALGKVPPLLGVGDLRGELHQHLRGPVEGGSIAQLVGRASQRGLEYVGVVLPGSEGGKDRADGVRRLRSAWAEIGVTPLPRLLVGYEAPCDEAQAMPRLPKGVDYLVLRPLAGPDGLSGPPPQLRSVPHPCFVAHLRLALDPSESLGARASAWIDWARSSGAALEVTPDAPTDGLDSGAIRRAVGSGARLHVSAGSTEAGQFEDLALSVGLARRGWATVDSVLNATIGFAARRAGKTD